MKFLKQEDPELFKIIYADNYAGYLIGFFKGYVDTNPGYLNTLESKDGFSLIESFARDKREHFIKFMTENSPRWYSDVRTEHPSLDSYYRALFVSTPADEPMAYALSLLLDLDAGITPTTKRVKH